MSKSDVYDFRNVLFGHSQNLNQYKKSRNLIDSQLIQISKLKEELDLNQVKLLEIERNAKQNRLEYQKYNNLFQLGASHGNFLENKSLRRVAWEKMYDFDQSIELYKERIRKINTQKSELEEVAFKDQQIFKSALEFFDNYSKNVDLFSLVTVAPSGSLEDLHTFLLAPDGFRHMFWHHEFDFEILSVNSPYANACYKRKVGAITEFTLPNGYSFSLQIIKSKVISIDKLDLLISSEAGWSNVARKTPSDWVSWPSNNSRYRKGG
jgi:transcription elongation GreA/GreB family factor